MKNIRIHKKHLTIKLIDDSIVSCNTGEFAQFMHFSYSNKLYVSRKNIFRNDSIVLLCIANLEYIVEHKILYLPGYYKRNLEKIKKTMKVDAIIVDNFDAILKDAMKFYNNLYKQYILYSKKNKKEWINLM